MIKPTMMKAMTYYGADDVRFEKRPIPVIIDPTDAIIRMTKTTICRTDLGICKGKNPEIEATARAKTGEWNGRILGHEGVGVVEEVGSAVKNFKKGDKVIISCVSRCGSCQNFQKQLYAHCHTDGGWIMGFIFYIKSLSSSAKLLFGATYWLEQFSWNFAFVFAILAIKFIYGWFLFWRDMLFYR
jgi:hypothetical protein